MKIQRIAILLTVINLVLLVFNLAQTYQATAEGVAPVLRGRALEIVDEQGKIRAQILVTAPTTMPDGTKYAESTLLRLIDPNGHPGVKINTSVDGSGMGLFGDAKRGEWSGIQMLAEGDKGTLVRVKNKDGREKLLKTE